MTRTEPEPAGDERDAPLAEIERREHEGVYAVAVRGELDISNLDLLRAAAMDIPNSALGLVVDLGGATFIDSATIGLLFELRQSVARRSQALRIVCPAGTPAERVLSLMSFAPELCRELSADAAISAIRREVPLGA